MLLAAVIAAAAGNRDSSGFLRHQHVPSASAAHVASTSISSTPAATMSSSWFGSSVSVASVTAVTVQSEVLRSNESSPQGPPFSSDERATDFPSLAGLQEATLGRVREYLNGLHVGLSRKFVEYDDDAHATRDQTQRFYAYLHDCDALRPLCPPREHRMALAAAWATVLNAPSRHDMAQGPRQVDAARCHVERPIRDRCGG